MVLYGYVFSLNDKKLYFFMGGFMYQNEIKINELSIPDELIEFIGSAQIFDSSGRSGAKTFFIDRDNGYYLKITDKNMLAAEQLMYRYFGEKDLSAKVLQYISTEKDYLLTEKIDGEVGSTKKYIDEPKKLCDVYAQSLRMLHEVDFSDCPNQ
ncbi:MAG: kanamycin kinase, partial [Clostridia bacterium]|nr:kanamycin kinase [Clostridia bacterium]